MKVLVTSGFVLMLLLSAGIASAEKPAPDSEEATESESSRLWKQELKATPEMWFYLQERARREDPKAVVRRAAELKAKQRRQRIAAKKAMDISNSRPNAQRTVFGQHFAPRYSYTFWANYYTRVWFAAESPTPSTGDRY